jgi:hypothetical protein
MVLFIFILCNINAYEPSKIGHGVTMVKYYIYRELFRVHANKLIYGFSYRVDTPICDGVFTKFHMFNILIIRIT